jgi:hypothetical protein
VSWTELPELARRERELVNGGRWEELLELQAERQQLIDSLPAELPAEARPALEAALRQSRATQAVLAEAMQATGGQLGTVRRGRRVVTAYGGPPALGLSTRA